MILNRLILKLYEVQDFNLRYRLAAWSISFYHVDEEIKHMSLTVQNKTDPHC